MHTSFCGQLTIGRQKNLCKECGGSHALPISKPSSCGSTHGLTIVAGTVAEITISASSAIRNKSLHLARQTLGIFHHLFLCSSLLIALHLAQQIFGSFHHPFLCSTRSVFTADDIVPRPVKVICNPRIGTLVDHVCQF